MSKTLSKRFQEIADFKPSLKVTAIKIYNVSNNDINIMSAVAEKEIDLYVLVSLITTDELYRKYKNYYVVVEAHDGDVYKVWIAKNS